jgi:dihydrofolate synthase/folylpolyglutamate synthase
LSEAEIAAYVAELEPVAERLARSGSGEAPSFFEFMTAMAFLQFARRACDAAVIEVGLGGRLDATNILAPEVCVITSIGLDHCELLGDTVAKIAAEKAGIIKPGVPVVMGRVPPEAEAVIRAIAAGRGAPVTSVREVFGENREAYPKSALEGDYQRWNAATATLAARAVAARFGLTEAHITTGLANVSWPGRWQRARLADGRLIVLDASHNPEGAEVLDGLLARLVAETGRRPVVVAGVLGTARALPLLAAVGRHASEVHLARPQQARASTFEELEALVPAEFFAAGGRMARGTVESLFPRAGVCAAGGPDDVLVVTGSIYLLGEVLARLEPERGENERRLQDF